MVEALALVLACTALIEASKSMKALTAATPMAALRAPTPRATFCPMALNRSPLLIGRSRAVDSSVAEADAACILAV